MAEENPERPGPNTSWPDSNPSPSPQTPHRGGGGGVCVDSFLEGKRDSTVPTPHTPENSLCHIDSLGDFCPNGNLEHVKSDQHVYTVSRFLVEAWGFRGVRQFVDRYGIALVNAQIVLLLADLVDPGSEPVRSPASLLTWRVKAAYDDNPEYWRLKKGEDL